MIKKYNRMFSFVVAVLMLSFLSASDAFALGSNDYSEALIYYNEACGMCADYVRDDLPEMLKSNGIEIIEKRDYVNEREARKEMNLIMEELEIPLPLQSHIMTFVGDKYVIGGHVPKHIIDGIFNSENGEKFKRVIVYQDEMHDAPTDYKILATPYYADEMVGEIKTYPIETGVEEYLGYLESEKAQLISSSGSFIGMNNHKYLMPVVLSSGFLDGINPCAFAVLLFFIAFLFSIKRTRRDIWKMGSVYILAIFLAYVLIGFGLMKALMFVNSPHFMARLGSWLVIILGGLNLAAIAFPKFPIKMKIPEVSKSSIKNWTAKATVPAALVLGFLVGLCTFPCSGGIYVAIIGLLAAKTTYWTGFSYLILYNIAFILPLVIILLLSANKPVVDRLEKMEKSESKNMKIISATAMIVLGIVILAFFT